jgi:hypothetical protein
LCAIHMISSLCHLVEKVASEDTPIVRDIICVASHGVIVVVSPRVEGRERVLGARELRDRAILDDPRVPRRALVGDRRTRGRPAARVEPRVRVAAPGGA